MNPISIIMCMVGIVGCVIGVATFVSAQIVRAKEDGFRQVIMTTCTNIYTFHIRKMGEMDLPKGSWNK